jgi:hypothetical protein
VSEIRTRTRPAPEPQVRVRTRQAQPPAEPVVRTRARPAAKATSMEGLGSAVTCGLCRKPEEAAGPLMGRVRNDHGKSFAYAYKGEGDPALSSSYLAVVEFADQEKAMAYLRSKHEERGCAGATPKKAKATTKPRTAPTWATGQDLSKIRTRRRG